MTATDLLALLRKQLFTVKLDRGGRVVVAPGSRLFPEDREAISAVRDELRELLLTENDPQWDALEAWPVAPVVVEKRSVRRRKK